MKNGQDKHSLQLVGPPLSLPELTNVFPGTINVVSGEEKKIVTINKCLGKTKNKVSLYGISP